MSILSAFVPGQKPNDCGEQIPVPCDGIKMPTIKIPGDFKIVYPSSVKDTLPLSGGAIIKINIENLEITPSIDVANVINRNLSALSNLKLTNSLKSLVKFRNEVNKQFFDIRGVKIVTDNKGRIKAPELFFSIFLGDDSSLKDNIANPGVNKVCKFSYIPTTALAKALENGVPVAGPDDRDDSRFEDVIGTSGSTFGKLRDDAQRIDVEGEGSLIKIILDMFPIYNIPEDEILGGSPSVVFGGFYTIFEENIYVKMPDLSGMNSAGFSSDLYTEGGVNLYLELLTGASLRRLRFKDFKAPPAAVAFETEHEFPGEGGESVKIELDTVLEARDIEAAYLSIIAKGADTKKAKSRSVKIFDNGAELFSIPMLTQNTIGFKNAGLPSVIPALLGSGSGAFKDIKPLSISDEINIDGKPGSRLNQYFKGFEREVRGSGDKKKVEILKNGTVVDQKDLGIPLFSVEDSNIFFGEKTRAELILSDREDDSSKKKNDKRYFRPQAYGSLEILAQNRPRIYSSVPSQWIKTVLKSDNPTEGTLTVEFTPADLSDINIGSSILKGEAEFALYLEDSLGQITRVPGRNIILSTSIPTITSIRPNGFSGGGGRLTFTSSPTLIIEGETLSGALELKVTSEAGAEFSIPLEDNDGLTSNTSSDTKISINFTTLLSESFPEESTIYNIRVVSASGKISSSSPIYISKPGEPLPLPPAVLLSFLETGEFSGVGFGKGAVVGVPLVADGKSAQIKIKSKSKLFKGQGDLFAYLAVENSPEGKDAVAKFSPGKTAILTGHNIEDSAGKPLAYSILIAKNIEYKFTGSDFIKLSNRKAILKFPGASYSSYNFSGLTRVGRAFIIITGRKLDEIVPDNGGEFSLNPDQYGHISIGDPDDNKAGFINPPIVKGLFAQLPGSKAISSTVPIPDDDDDIKSLFNNLVDGDVDGINAYRKINKLAVVFSGLDDGIFLNKKYTFTLGSEKLKKKIRGRIFQKSGTASDPSLVAVFRNISTSQEGILNLNIEKNDRKFGVVLNSRKSIRQATVLIKDGNYEIDEDTSQASILSDIDTVIKRSNLDNITTGAFIVGDKDPIDSLPDGSIEKNMDLLIPQLGSGIQIKENDTSSETFHNFFTPISLFTNADIKIEIEKDKDKKILKGIEEGEIFSLSRLVLTMPAGSFFSDGDYETNDDGDLIGFLKVDVGDPAAIRFNLPEVVAIDVGKGLEFFKNLKDGETIKIKADTDVEIMVINSKKNFVIKLGDFITVNTKGKAERVSGKPKGTYIATIRIPSIMAGVSIDSSGSCFKICGSVSNNNRLGAKFALGNQFVIDIDKKMQELLFGPLMDKIPDIDDLKKLLEKTPLRFVQFLLDKAMAIGKLISSFCDLSFHLTLELKLNLNGLQLLMIPIQVILCIIDVICALLNPVKVVRAVIRLFECLYDLLLLLPQISIPVMYLQLVLHLLELIKCLIEKIIFTIIAINQIITAIDRAIRDKNWPAIKNLEEVLSQYLFSIEADLQFLEPIIAIIAIFLELLQLVFRFPCAVDPGGGDPSCGLDGTMLAGIVAGLISPGGDEVLPDALIPVAQPYTDVSIADAAINIPPNGGSEPYEEPNGGNKVAEQTDSTTFLDSMNVDPDSLRSNTSFAFNATFAPSFTKSSMSKRPTVVKFKFNERGRNGAFRKRKVIDPLQTMDSPIRLMKIVGSDLEVAGGKGNFISPIDGHGFMTINADDKGTIKPLTLEFVFTERSVDPETEEIIEAGSIITRTFDDIPSMVILDDGSAAGTPNLYFIEPNGIEFDGNEIKSIKAKMVNLPAATKSRLSREDQEVDLTPEDELDDEFEEVKVFDFPQFYFVDMRQASDEIQQSCYNASINSFLFEEDNTDDITDIVEEGRDCVDTFISQVKGVIGDVRTSQLAGQIPSLIDVDAVQGFADTFADCFGGTGDAMCRYVVNTLNTSFRVLEDEDETPLDGFPDFSVDEDILEDFESETPALTGAREYAAGIGDSAVYGLGEKATIIMIPRDSYDKAIGGDLSNRLVLEIVGDTTGAAEIVRNKDGSFAEIDGDSYLFRITSNAEGEVKLRAKVCDRTIQAVTFDGIAEDIDVEDNVLINCISDSLIEASNSSPPLGALTKVDRILTLFFIRKSRVVLAESTERGSVAISEPQESGTILEN